MDDLDVLVVGAGISGIGAAHWLKARCPGRSFEIYEARDRIGGTWDLFRYPGIRSDSDMFTLGFAFRPWTSRKAIADGPDILSYLDETARAENLLPRIRFGRKVVAADWDSARQRWVVSWEEGPERTPGQVLCRFLYMCSGYYNYAAGHRPDFPGEAEFAGRIVHPQFWPEDLDVAGRKVVVIGSGATAVTLVPALAKMGARVTMLQRSPTWVVSRPGEDALANGLRKILPARLAHTLIRWRNILFQLYFYNVARKHPEQVKARLLDMLKPELPDGFDIARHFTPSYNPWDQRLCLVPDADLFKALRDGSAEVVTDHIERFDSGGISLASGGRLDADIIVTATGLDLQVLSGMKASVDGVPVDFGRTFSYKGVMYSGVPNLASAFGYTNASWTLKADLTSEWLCRVLNHMQATGAQSCRPEPADPDMKPGPWLDFSSGYVVRAMERFPKQGDRPPWKVNQNYVADVFAFRFGRLDDGALRFSA